MGGISLSKGGRDLRSTRRTTRARFSGFAMAFVAPAFVAGALFMSVPAAQAASFKAGEADISIDTTISLGTAIRTSKQDCAYIAPDNGGCTTTGAPRSAALGNPGSGYGRGVNEDDGNINSPAGKPFSMVVKLSSELQVKWRDYGMLMRAKAYYDYWGAEELGKHNSGFGKRPPTDLARGDRAIRGNNHAGHGIKLLDAFVYGNLTLGELPLNLRLGNQVVNWGESLFFQGGVNSFQPIDVSAIRTPGAELKDAYLPTPMIYAQLGLPAGFGIEAYYQFGWERTRLDACGTFFSATDGFCEGGAYLMLGGYEYNHMIPGLGLLSQNLPGVFIPRIASQYAREQGQWGVKASYYADWLNDGTDIGLYFVNFHSNKPIATFTSADVMGANAAQLCAAVGMPLFAPAAFCLAQPAVAGILIGAAGAGNVRTLTQYPEDIHQIGLSFNTTIPGLLGGTALSGEIAYSPNMPFQVADTTINANSLANIKMDALAIAAASGRSVLEAIFDSAAAPRSTLLTDGRSLSPDGSVIPGYERLHVWTGQISTMSTLSTSHPVSSFLGADLIPLIANVGFQYLPNKGRHANLAVTQSGAYSHQRLVDFMLGDAVCPGGATGAGLGTCEAAQYATKFSWGYRLVAIVQYNNVLGTAWTLSPYLQWQHDVDGYSAGPNGPDFIQGRKAVTLGFTATTMSVWKVTADWTSSFGNRFQNHFYDKDFVQLSVSYAF